MEAFWEAAYIILSQDKCDELAPSAIRLISCKSSRHLETLHT